MILFSDTSINVEKKNFYRRVCNFCKSKATTRSDKMLYVFYLHSQQQTDKQHGRVFRLSRKMVTRMLSITKRDWYPTRSRIRNVSRRRKRSRVRARA